MRTPEQIIEAVKKVFEQYDEQFPETGGFADKDIQQLIARTKARRRADFLDNAADALALTDAEIEAFEKHQDEQNSKRMEELFHQMIEVKDMPKAEYILNNMRRVWSLEKRQELVKKFGDSYDINPITGNVDTKHQIKKQLKKQAQQQSEVGE